MTDVNVARGFDLNPDIDAIINTRSELEGSAPVIDSIRPFVRPLIYWKDVTVDGVRSDGVSLNRGRFNIDSVYVARGLKDCQKAVVAAATIGQGLPDYSRKCIAEKKFWEGTIADLVGSYAIEALIERFHHHLVLRYRQKGLHSSQRFSPGYGDWRLEDQAKIVTFLGTRPEITVNPNFILQPVKSITCILGWSPIPLPGEYPRGDRTRGLCRGTASCASCRTWACMKEE